MAQKATVLSSEHDDRAAVLTASQNLWSPTQDQCSQNSGVDGGETHEVLTLAEVILASDGSWGREVIWGCGHW